MSRCVFISAEHRCTNEGTIKVGGIPIEWWLVCRAHVRWWHPSYMPRWWYWATAATPGALILAGVIVYWMTR